LNSIEERWLVVCTKSRAEKKVSEKIESLGFESYCPMLRIRKKWSDRWKWVEEPLIRGYVFVKTDHIRQNEVLQLPSVIAYLKWLSKPAVVLENEILQLKKLLGESWHEDLIIEQYKEGDQLLITSGILAGKEATLIKQSGKKLILVLKELGLQVSLNVSSNEVLKS